MLEDEQLLSSERRRGASDRGCIDRYRNVYSDDRRNIDVEEERLSGREKLHYLNPVPIHEIYDRWVKKFERRSLLALDQLKKQLEGESHD